MNRSFKFLRLEKSNSNSRQEALDAAMEDSVRAAFFVDSIAEFLTERYVCDWTWQCGMDSIRHELDAFDDGVAVSVLFLIYTNYLDISCCSEEMLRDVPDICDLTFFKLVLEAAPRYFPNGYTAEKFIAYCAMVFGVSVLHAHEERRGCEFLQTVSGVVSTVLIGFMMTGDFEKDGGWANLTVKSTALNYCFQMKQQREREAKDGV